MVTQKAISFKIDEYLLEELDKEVSLGWMKRNRHINEAIKFYLEYKDARRRQRMFQTLAAKNGEVQDFIKKWFPDC